MPHYFEENIKVNTWNLNPGFKSIPLRNNVNLRSILASWHCKWKMLPAISVNKGCCSHQAITIQPPGRWALRELRMETGCPPSSHQPLQHSRTQRCTLRRLRMRKYRILAPDSWGAYQRNDFSEPRLLHLPIQNRAKFLDLRCLVVFNEQ